MSDSSFPPAVETADVIVAGGGMVGMALAAALGGAGVRTVVLDRLDPHARTDAAYDGRVVALSEGTRRILDGIGAWAGMAAKAEAMREIRITDGDAPVFLHYDHREVGDVPFGHVVENRDVRRALLARLGELDAVRLVAPAELVDLSRDGGGVVAATADARRFAAPLVVGAEGRHSPVRRAAGIGVREWRYGQTAIVCTVGHEKPHRGIAHERFLPAGPFAILPMADDPAPDRPLGRHRSSIVWTERAALVPRLLALDGPAFAAELRRRFGGFLGETAVLGGRWSYPLGAMHADRYVADRVAVVGDAAHGIHPIAGQGLNLGLRDVAALAEVLVDAFRLGLDLGGETVLERYARWRGFDTVGLIAITDGLNRLFSNDVLPVRLLRDAGLAAVGRLPPLKRVFMRHAMGTLGDLPRLARGERL